VETLCSWFRLFAAATALTSKLGAREAPLHLATAIRTFARSAARYTMARFLLSRRSVNYRCRSPLFSAEFYEVKRGCGALLWQSFSSASERGR
jgi:hypothetical protein